MFDFLGSVCYMVYCGMIDFMVFILVDVVAKNLLKDANDTQEKGMIWLLESACLLFLSLVIYILHHTPYALLGLAAITFGYTQALRNISLRSWWNQLKTKWDEFQQHEESMEQLQHRQMAAPPPVMIPNFTAWQYYPAMPPSTTAAYDGRQRYELPAEPWYAVCTSSNSQGQVGRTVVTQATRIPNMTPVAMPAVSQQMRYRGVSNQGINLENPPLYSIAMDRNRMVAAHQYTPILPRGSTLVRPGIHSRGSQESGQQSNNISLSFKSRFMSAIGMNPYVHTPPGLKNGGQNICFMNSVVQCLSHSPSLIDFLPDQTVELHCGAQESTLIHAFTETVEHLNVKPGTSDVSVLDLYVLRQAAAGLSGSLVGHPARGPQTQQDAAEFLMWLLYTLHNALNQSKPVTTNVNGSVQGDADQGGRMLTVPRYSSSTLSILKFIYGDLTPARIEELKEACKREIEMANGLDNDSYAEPIQRLSDLEWLTYKQNNDSVVDDLFTGQMVEAQHCTACNRISVGIQTFSVLPVPIVEPRQMTGIVFLQDCFAKFGNIEHLYGNNGLCCETCNKKVRGGTRSVAVTPMSGNPHVFVQQSTPSVGTPIKPSTPLVPNGGNHIGISNLHRQNILNSDSAVHSTFSPSAVLSPIAATGSDVLNDSGFHDNQFKTSTPIQAQKPPPKLTNGQRRSLLRQLPKCLTVQLLRFTYNNGQSHKIHRPVSIPLVKLDLTSLIYDNVTNREDLTAVDASYQYNLYGVSVHLGADDTSHGHYIAYVLAEDNNWYKFDDEKVTAVNMEYELNTRQLRENAYLLYYKRSTG